MCICTGLSLTRLFNKGMLAWYVEDTLGTGFSRFNYNVNVPVLLFSLAGTVVSDMMLGKYLISAFAMLVFSVVGCEQVIVMRMRRDRTTKNT